MRAYGWDVLAIGESSPGMEDHAVLALAAEEHRWLATFDRDYGDLIYRLRYPAPVGVVLLRVSSYKPDEPALWLNGLFTQGHLVEGYFHRFDGETIRRRRFPNSH
jgi:predicted nuclease of predicted toxin-antitoxin system